MTDIRDAHLNDNPYGDSHDEHADHDEHAEWGPDDDVPRTPLALRPEKRAALAEAINDGLRERGCDNTLRVASAWARRERVPWPGLRAALEERGGFCDCEVLMNVFDPPD